MKIFHWLMQDRIDFMEQGINQSWLFHIRICSVIIILLLLDIILLGITLDYTLKFGISMVIVLGFEYTILFSNALTGLLKYILHSIDLRRENPWENKSMYIFYIDLVREFFVLVCYVIFFAVIVHRYGLPLHLMRDLYVTFRSFIQHCRDLIHYKKATRNMNERYPNATLEDLTESDNICIICREEMTIQEDNNSSDVPKKLRCGHIFHLRCLKSWLERQQSCPTCRCSLLDTTPVNNNNNNRNNKNTQPVKNLDLFSNKTTTQNKKNDNEPENTISQLKKLMDDKKRAREEEEKKEKEGNKKQKTNDVKKLIKESIEKNVSDKKEISLKKLIKTVTKEVSEKAKDSKDVKKQVKNSINLIKSGENIILKF